MYQGELYRSFSLDLTFQQTLSTSLLSIMTVQEESYTLIPISSMEIVLEKSMAFDFYLESTIAWVDEELVTDALVNVWTAEYPSGEHGIVLRCDCRGDISTADVGRPIFFFLQKKAETKHRRHAWLFFLSPDTVTVIIGLQEEYISIMG